MAFPCGRLYQNSIRWEASLNYLTVKTKHFVKSSANQKARTFIGSSIPRLHIELSHRHFLHALEFSPRSSTMKDCEQRMLRGGQLLGFRVRNLLHFAFAFLLTPNY
jgi:hypothetical protein